MEYKPFMYDTLTREVLEAGRKSVGIAHSLAEVLLIQLVRREHKRFAELVQVHGDRQVLVESDGLEVVEITQTTEPKWRDRQFRLHILAGDASAFNYLRSASGGFVVRADYYDPLAEGPAANGRRLPNVVGFVNAAEIMGLRGYLDEMQGMELAPPVNSSADQ